MASNLKGKVALGSKYLKNLNAAGYDPLGSLRKLTQRQRSRGGTQILPTFGSNGVKIRVLWAFSPKGKVARGPMYLKNPNAAGYDPVGGLGKQIKRPRSRRDTHILPIFGLIGVPIGV